MNCSGYGRMQKLNRWHRKSHIRNILNGSGQGNAEMPNIANVVDFWGERRYNRYRGNSRDIGDRKESNGQGKYQK